MSNTTKDYLDQKREYQTRKANRALKALMDNGFEKKQAKAILYAINIIADMKNKHEDLFIHEVFEVKGDEN